MDTNKSREELTSEANRVREELVETVGRLDHLRHDPLGLSGHVGEALTRMAAIGAAIVVAAGTAAIVLRNRESAPLRLRRDRLRLLSDAWRRPARILRAEQPSFLVRMTQSLALAVLTAAAKMLSKQAVARLGRPTPKE